MIVVVNDAKQLYPEILDRAGRALADNRPSFNIYAVPRLVGMPRAAEWVYTGRVFDAGEALAGGLVSRILPPDELLPAARTLACEIVDHTSAISVALARQMMWKLLGADHPMEAHRLDSRAMAATGASADAREGVTAFLEKRPARFTGRPSADMPSFYPWWPSRPFRP